MQRLFHRFERLDEGRNRRIEGTGLGLSITQQLLGMMGSHLNVESEYGVGSVFSFDLEQRIIDEASIGNFEKKISEESKIIIIMPGFMRRKQGYLWLMIMQ